MIPKCSAGTATDGKQCPLLCIRSKLECNVNLKLALELFNFVYTSCSPLWPQTRMTTVAASTGETL